MPAPDPSLVCGERAYTISVGRKTGQRECDVPGTFRLPKGPNVGLIDGEIARSLRRCRDSTQEAAEAMPCHAPPRPMHHPVTESPPTVQVGRDRAVLPVADGHAVSRCHLDVGHITECAWLGHGSPSAGQDRRVGGVGQREQMFDRPAHNVLARSLVSCSGRFGMPS